MIWILYHTAAVVFSLALLGYAGLWAYNFAQATFKSKVDAAVRARRAPCNRHTASCCEFCGKEFSEREQPVLEQDGKWACQECIDA